MPSKELVGGAATGLASRYSAALADLVARGNADVTVLGALSQAKAASLRILNTNFCYFIPVPFNFLCIFLVKWVIYVILIQHRPCYRISTILCSIAMDVELYIYDLSKVESHTSF